MTHSPRKAPPSATGVLPRKAALRLLDAVLRRGQPLESALPAATRELDLPADRALAHSIAAFTLRYMTDLDRRIDGATRKRLPDDAKARMVLRVLLAQVWLMGTPPHAAIATALPLVDGGPRKLVHGVASALLKSGEGLPVAPHLPLVVEQRWRSTWGEAVVEAARSSIAGRPMLDLSLRDAGDTASLAAELAAISLAQGHLRLASDSVVTSLPGFERGDWWVQDLAATIPARLLGQGGGRTVLDLCAAPGGKTMQLAAAGWQVVAMEESPRRAERLHANLERTGLTATIVEADARIWEPERQFDAILLDAPCSATGIFRRHPDVLHRVGRRQVEEMAELQRTLLARAAKWLAPGGRLVFATCSLEPEEGEAQIASALSADLDLHPVAIDQGLLPAGLKSTNLGQVRILPGALAEVGGLDGFFIALLQRVSGSAEK